MPSIRHKRGTRSQIDTAAGNGALKAGEVYFITDEDRLAVGLSASSYQAMAKEGEGGAASPIYWQQMPMSGRCYLYNDRRWVAAGADDNYSFSYYQWAESGGSGADPIQEWEHKGYFIRGGTICKELSIFGRILDAATIADVEFFISFTDPQGRWDGIGVDKDTEDAHTLLYRGFWKAGGSGVPAWTMPINDDIRRDFPLTPNNDGSAPFVAPADGNLRLYIRPVNVDPRPNTSTDYAQLSGSWLISHTG